MHGFISLLMYLNQNQQTEVDKVLFQAKCGQEAEEPLQAKLKSIYVHSSIIQT